MSNSMFLRDRRVFLKIKIKSLIAETKIIKLEESKQKAGSILQSSMISHRVKEVQTELRAAYIAYGFLRGLSYELIEHWPRTRPNMDRVRDLVKKYKTTKFTTQEITQKFAEWEDTANQYVTHGFSARTQRKWDYTKSPQFAESLRLASLPEEEKKKIRLERKMAFLKSKGAVA